MPELLCRPLSGSGSRRSLLKVTRKVPAFLCPFSSEGARPPDVMRRAPAVHHRLQLRRANISGSRSSEPQSESRILLGWGQTSFVLTAASHVRAGSAAWITLLPSIRGDPLTRRLLHPTVGDICCSSASRGSPSLRPRWGRWKSSRLYFKTANYCFCFAKSWCFENSAGAHGLQCLTSAHL